MTEEMIKETKKEECNCFCKSEGFRNFIVVATGTFVGVFCAISLFAALHKPPKMIPMQPHFAAPCPIQHVQPRYHHNFDKGPRHIMEKRMHKEFAGRSFHHKFQAGKDKPDFKHMKHHKFQNMDKAKFKKGIEKQEKKD